MNVALYDAQALAAIVPQWDALAAAASEPNPYYESWALLPALETCGAGVPFRCVAVHTGDELAALFPLEPVSRYRGVPARGFRTWRHRHMLLGTPLVRAGMEREAWDALLGWLRGASILELDYVQAQGPVYAGLRAALQARGRPWKADHAFERAILRRASDGDAYLAAAMSGDQRRELRRKEKRLKDAGSVRYVRLGKDGDAASWIEDFIRIEASGWKGKAGGALACREPDLAFSRALFRGAFERGRLHAVGVDLDGKAIARELCLLGGDGAFSVRIAYDEHYARFAPGLLCEMENIRAFHDAPAPAPQWMDSYTSSENATIGKLWKDRIRIERVAAALDGWGGLVLAALPMLRRAKRSVSALAASGAAALSARRRISIPRSAAPAQSSRPPAGSSPS